MTVSEAQIEAGIEAAEKQFWESVSSHDVKAIYLAMKAAEPLAQGDEGLFPPLSPSIAKELDRLNALAREQGDELTELRAALVRPIGDDVREVLTEARRYVHETITTQARREIMLAKIDAAITAIGSQSIEGERG